MDLELIVIIIIVLAIVYSSTSKKPKDKKDFDKGGKGDSKKGGDKYRGK